MMLLAVDCRRQARVCARLAEDCDDLQLADRLRAMASDLLALADDFENTQETGGARRTRAVRALAA
jgi:hypothetical protein